MSFQGLTLRWPIAGQVLIGQVERRGDRQVLRLQQLRPVPRSRQLGRPPGRCPSPMMVQMAGHYPDCQRQVPAQPCKLAHPRLGRARPVPTGQPDQQIGRLTRRQGIQADRPGVLQRGQAAPAGHQHQAPARAGQQREHLLAASGIIEYQQQAPARQPATPQRRPYFQPGGICAAATPAISSKLASASPGATGCRPGVCPCSGRKICPAGNRSASRCAACTANAVLPTPARQAATRGLAENA